MREVTGDLWIIKADAKVIPTNGIMRRDGAAVMGRGVALQAKQRYPKIEFALGTLLKNLGNHVYYFYCETDFLSFPVKHHWKTTADLNLIERSCQELVTRVNAQHQWKRIALPRVGCGNGGLDWKDVKPILEKYLDDRFIVVKWKEEA